MRVSAVRNMISALVLAIVAGIGSSFMLAAIALLLSPDAAAAKLQETHAEDSGRLQLLSRHGQLVQDAPRLKTSVQMDVNGMLARVRVKQRFLNISAAWVEGVYSFPLPEDSAVDHMRLVYADRVIEGDIKEREQARRVYQKARDAGQKASLLAQQRPNMFTTRVANIPPGEEVLVEIEYQQQLSIIDGVFSLRFPMVIGPRYIPGEPIVEEQPGFAGEGWARATRQVPDADRITPPWVEAGVLSGGQNADNPVSLRVDLNAGMELASVDSLYHATRVKDLGEGRYQVDLSGGDVPADRDFVLRWRPQALAFPQAALFRENWQGAGYGLLMVLPPQQLQQDTPLLNRELILVVDTSGSMHGASIGQARAALRLALQQLRPGDRFNLIQFNNVTHSLFKTSLPASQANKQRALDYVEGLEADGGTEMLPAMARALGDQPESRLLRQVVFLTDGNIGNERALFKLIKQRLGNSRLFPVGIGSAPNSFFMTRAAQFGRGSFTYIGDLNDVREQMTALFSRLQSPVLTDVRVQWDGQVVRQAPARVPDLYHGEPLVLAVRMDNADAPSGQVTISGQLGNQAWQRTIHLQGGRQARGVHVLWARRMIRDAMAGQSLGDDVDKVRQTVVDLALEHHLVSRYTSLVAVDKTPARAPNEKLQQKQLPGLLPHGWSARHLVGNMPNTATPASLFMLVALFALLLSRWLHIRGLR